MWASSGRVANPVLDQVLVDTGPLVAKQRMFQVYISANANTVVEIQWRDAANAATLKSQVIAVPAFSFQQFQRFLEEIDMLANQRIRLIAVAAVAGMVSASLEYNA